MKNAHTLVLLAGLTCVFAIEAAPSTGDLVAKSDISAVTVYLDRARVTRIAEVDLPAGESLVRFVNLPATLDESSVTATGESAGNVKIEGIEIRQKFSERIVNDAVQKLQEEIQQIQDEFRKLDDEMRDVSERRAFLQQLKDGITRDMGKDEKGAPMTAAQIKSLFDLYGNEINLLSQRTRQIDLEKRALQPKQAKLQNELNRLVSQRPTVQREVLVSVTSKSATPAAIQVSYVMPGASWQPIYDARARVDASRIDLGYYAQVWQRTGEDWKDVKLSVSTARPNVGARMPDLGSWWLQVGGPVPASMSELVGGEMFRDQVGRRLARNERAAAKSVAGQLSADELREDKPDLAALVQETAVADTQGVSAVFHVKLPTSIPSDGEPHRTMIAMQSFKGKLDYVTTPKLMQTAFLKAHLTNNTDLPILGGQVNLFLEDDFIGKSHVNYIAPTAEFDFFLGVDDGIKVTRKQTLDRTETAGIFKKETVSIRKFEIEIQNFKKTAQTVNVHDQIPVSQNEQIRVTGVKYSEKPREVEKETGKVTWEFALQPGEKKKITIEFSVERPVGLQIAGI